MEGSLGFGGTLVARKIKAQGPGLAWKLRNMIRWAYVWGWIANNLAWLFSKVTGIPTITGTLYARKYDAATRQWINYGVLGRRVVTNAGVGFLNDAWNNTVELEIMNYHTCGTDNTAEDASDTTLGAECTTALNPDSTRQAGTQTQPSANVMQSVATLTFDDTAAVVEHGLVSTASGAYVLWDRTVFAAINVASGDSIQFTYQCTLNAGS